MVALKPCPFCGAAPVWGELISDVRSAEFVGLDLSCKNETCAMQPGLKLHTDGKWIQGKGTPTGLNRDPELITAWSLHLTLPLIEALERSGESADAYENAPRCDGRGSYYDGDGNFCRTCAGTVFYPIGLRSPHPDTQDPQP